SGPPHGPHRGRREKTVGAGAGPFTAFAARCFMNQADHEYPESQVPLQSPPSGPALAQDDPRVIQALEEYIAALKDGRQPSRKEFQARYPEIAEALAECLEGLEFIHGAAPRLHQSVAEQAAAASASGAEFQPEGPLGDYRIVREIGRGGMGVVYEAVQI